MCKSLWREEQWSRDHQRQTTRKPKRTRANGSWISPWRSLAPSRGNKPDFKKRAAERSENMKAVYKLFFFLSAGVERKIANQEWLF